MDIDTDLADRDYIIQYLIDKYGEDRVCQIINFSYITPCVAIKDVGRVLGIPYAICDKISKKFVQDTFEECMKANADMTDYFDEYKELFDIAAKVSGRVRNVSIHAGGVGIVDTKITDYMGMKLGAKNEHVIQVDKHVIEDIGIIKFDLLGVKTLSIVQEVQEDTGLSDWDLNINNPKFANDKDMFKLLQSANTNGVFQVESQGMKDLLTRLQPTSLEDVSAVLALYRPDSMGALEDFIERRTKHIPPVYIHPDMAGILDVTCGCLIYQEQLMDIVRKFGGRTYGGADLFRKAIGKKNKELVQQESDKLEKEIIQNGYPVDIAHKIHDELRTKGGYLFNKSHSALYSILTLKTAYLKAHYPAYFFKALLNQNKTDYGVINKYILDAKQFGIQVKPPNINKSQREFSVVNGSVLFGLEAIKGIGESVVDEILAERENGLFKGLNDFISRVNPSVSVMVALIKSGAIPCKSKSEILIRYADSLMESKTFTPLQTLPTLKVLKEKYGIECDDRKERLRQYNEIRKKEFYTNQALKKMKFQEDFKNKYMTDPEFWEFETLSIFLERNPFDEAFKYIKLNMDDIEDEQSFVVVGIIANVQKKKDRHGNQYAFINIYSTFGLMEAVCWAKQYKEYEDLIKRGSQIAAVLKKGELMVFKKMKPYKKWLEDKGLAKERRAMIG